MTERDQLLAAVAAHPEEDTPRLIFADYLDENGELEHDRTWAEYIRLAIKDFRTPSSGWLKTIGSLANVFGSFGNGLFPQAKELSAAVLERETKLKKLWEIVSDAYGSHVDGEGLNKWIVVFYSMHQWERGFPCIVHNFDIEFWMRSAPILCKRFPITQVEINNRRPLYGNTWSNGDAKSSGYKGIRALFSNRRVVSDEDRKLCELPEPIFRRLPGVESHHNWIMYTRNGPTGHTADTALQHALLRYGRETPISESAIAK